MGVQECVVAHVVCQMVQREHARLRISVAVCYMHQLEEAQQTATVSTLELSILQLVHMCTALH